MRNIKRIDHPQRKNGVNHNDEIIDCHNKIHISDFLADLIKIHNYIPSPKHIKHATATSITQIRFLKQRSKHNVIY